MDETELVKHWLLNRRTEWNADEEHGKGKCLRVNWETACILAYRAPQGAIVHAWEDQAFKNLNWRDDDGYHVIGTYRATNGHWLGFDGTADQVNGQTETVLIVQGETEDEVLEKLNKQLKGNFRIQKSLESAGRKVDAR